MLKALNHSERTEGFLIFAPRLPAKLRSPETKSRKHTITPEGERRLHVYKGQCPAPSCGSGGESERFPAVLSGDASEAVSLMKNVSHLQKINCHHDTKCVTDC